MAALSVAMSATWPQVPLVMAEVLMVLLGLAMGCAGEPDVPLGVIGCGRPPGGGGVGGAGYHATGRHRTRGHRSRDSVRPAARARRRGHAIALVLAVLAGFAGVAAVAAKTL